MKKIISHSDTEKKPLLDRLFSGNTREKSDLVTSLEMLVNDNFIEGKTILNNKQVTALTMMNWGGQVYDIPFLNDFVEKWSRYRISGDDGRGRNEIIEIAKAIQQAKETENKQLMDLLSRK